jgi:hypothetical protein
LNLTEKCSRKLKAFIIISSFAIFLILQGSEPYRVLASIGQQNLTSLAFEESHYLSSSRIDKTIDQTSVSSQKYSSNSTQTPDRGIKTVTIVDHAEPVSPTRQIAPFSILATDPCGDGSNQFTTENGGIRWRTFPVTYAIDTTNSGVDPNAARSAVIGTFEEFDKYIPGGLSLLSMILMQQRSNLGGSSLMVSLDKRDLPLFRLPLLVLLLLQQR